MKLFTNMTYEELETHEADYNDICPEHEIRAEIESYIPTLWDEEAEFEDILKHEPQK